MENLVKNVVGHRNNKACISKEFWRGKRVLITGHTGFKGTWLVRWLARLGADVYGVSLSRTTDIAMSINYHCKGEYFFDLRDSEKTKELLKSIEPEVVFHFAAQSLVIEGYNDPLTTFSTNILGTVNILEGLRTLDCCLSVVVATTDKVYENRDWIWPYRESDTLCGVDPYSASKVAVETVVKSYKKCFFDNNSLTTVCVMRAGNVIGGGDYSANRLIPDMILSWENQGTLSVRSPDSVRPWQHVLEAIHAYLILAQETSIDPPSNEPVFNYGPSSSDFCTVRQLCDIAKVHLPGFAYEEKVSDENYPEAKYLTLDSSYFASCFNHSPVADLEWALSSTFGWYLKHSNGIPSEECFDEDILSFERMTMTC